MSGENYRKELVQVAASALAMAQDAACGTTSLDYRNSPAFGSEGKRGFHELMTLQYEVTEERKRQELKWGTRHHLPRQFWLAVLMEEVGEVADEILKQSQVGDMALVVRAAALGMDARAWLESQPKKG